MLRNIYSSKRSCKANCTCGIVRSLAFHYSALKDEDYLVNSLV